MKKIKKAIYSSVVLVAFLLPASALAQSSGASAVGNSIGLNINSVTSSYNGSDVTEWYNATFFNSGSYQYYDGGIAASATAYGDVNSFLEVVNGSPNPTSDNAGVAGTSNYTEGTAYRRADGDGFTGPWAQTSASSDSWTSPYSSYAAAGFKQELYLYSGETTFTMDYSYLVSLLGPPQGYTKLEASLYLTPYGSETADARDVFSLDLSLNNMTEYPSSGTGTLSVTLENIVGDPQAYWLEGEVRSWSGAQAVPIPGAVWLLGSGLVGMIGFRQSRKK